jgi:branched-chain amino acid transport system ATP-binding protein
MSSKLIWGPGMPLLEVRHLYAGYGDIQILHDVSLTIGDGEVVSLVGANGAGKTTLLRSLSGILPSVGTVRFDGIDVTEMPPHDRVHLGIAHVPEGRQLFPTMTVAENLTLGIQGACSAAERRRRFDQIFTLFPQISDRQAQLAGTLSGGEQQMVAIGRGLMLAPRLLMLDEPSLGLAPAIVARIFGTVTQVNQLGVAVLLVEQNVVESLRRSARAYVLERGVVVREGPAEGLLHDERTRAAYLGGNFAKTSKA